MVNGPKLLLSVSREGTTAENYTEALLASGAGEVCVVNYPVYNEDYDALVLPGGGDVDPSYYGEALDGSNGIDPDRDAAEIALIQAFAEAGKPILGICRGHQTLNVAFGGSLWQHMPYAQDHTSEDDRNDRIHPTIALADSLIGRLYGETPVVNSYHHQAVKQLAEAFRATQWWVSPEGERFVEAMEHVTLPIISVQWHPERTTGRFLRTDTVDGSLLLRQFILLCEVCRRGEKYSEGTLHA